MRLTKLKLVRMKSGFTQTNSAKLIGISRSYLAMMENNFVPPTDEVLSKLAKLYSVPIKELKE